MIKEKYYYAQLEYIFVNYIFRKDNSYMRMPDTRLLKDSIIYSVEQIKILRKLHPDLIALSHKSATSEMKAMPKTYKVNESHFQTIIKYLS